MKQKIISLHRVIGITLFIIGIAGSFCKTFVLASETGTAYLAQTNPTYKHPITGEIEDIGKNEGIGQGMTESVLNSKALIEKGTDGKIYATVRFYLTDNISNVSFQTQKKETSKWVKSPSKIMQENIGNKYCTDYRFQIPDQTVIVKTEFYVAPMGRNVIFYFTFSNLKKGNGDFLVTVSEVKNQKTETKVNKNLEKKKETKALSVAGADLIEQADGLVRSDSSKNQFEKKEKNIKEKEVIEKKESHSNSVDALPWTFVWQCILIITIPPCMIGVVIVSGICFIKRMGDLE